MQKTCGCHKEKNEHKHKGLWQGIIYGIIPHFFCILYIIFALIGSIVGMSFAKKFLLLPHFFSVLLGVSLLFATLSAWLYLQKNNCQSLAQIKQKWKYLTSLYGLTIAVNIAFVYIIFPALANNVGGQQNSSINDIAQEKSIITVDIPCPGHAPLIIDEIRNNCEVNSVKFQEPNFFEIQHNPIKTSDDKILSLKIFNIYKAKLIK